MSISDSFVTYFVSPEIHAHLTSDKYNEAIDATCESMANLIVSYIPKCLGGQQYHELRSGSKHLYKKVIWLGLTPARWIFKCNSFYRVFRLKAFSRVELESKKLAAFSLDQIKEWLVIELIPVVVAVAISKLSMAISLDHLKYHQHYFNNSYIKGIDFIIHSFIIHSNVLVYVIITIKLLRLIDAVVKCIFNNVHWDRDWLGTQIGYFKGDCLWPLSRNVRICGVQITEKN